MARPQKLDVLQQDIDKLQAALNDQNDLICAVTSTSYLDHCLLALLAQRLERGTGGTADGLFDPNGPLGSLYNKARLAYCLGALTKTQLMNVDRIGKIRNQFAHNLDKSFADQAVKSLCESLDAPIDHKGESRFAESIKGNPRNRFVMVSAILCTQILSCMSSYSAQKDLDMLFEAARQKNRDPPE